ncbi:MAG: hypothetical protein AB7V13_24360 [Pseudorhodoplanes sp.]|uniref:hypothetical protein n=1 Tax=Pseudorhodoplanes sp. TaxID=1934341 RepID=UPI003D0E5292
MPADKTKRDADAPVQADPVRDKAKADSRDLIAVNEKSTPRKPRPSRYADTLFLAHVFASKFDAPQQREKRRADPADANASYRKTAKRPVKTGRVLSKKV